MRLGVETQRPRDGVDDLSARFGRPPLFEPGVPGHAHPGSRGDLLAAQAGSDAPAPGELQTDIFGVDVGPSGAEKIGELGPPGCCQVGRHGPHTARLLLAW
jgi:hypothetical protein